MSAQSRIKRRKIHHHDADSPQHSISARSNTIETADAVHDHVDHNVTPKKGSRDVPLKETESQDVEHLIPLSRTLGLFKKYHSQSPSKTPAASPSSARKTTLHQDNLSPSKRAPSNLSPCKRANASPPSTAISLSTKLGRSALSMQRSSSHVNKPGRLPDTPSKRAYVISKSSTRRAGIDNTFNVNLADSPSQAHRDDSAIVIEDSVMLEATHTPSKQQKTHAETPQEQDAESDGDEIVVRSSGRKRTVSQKLRAAREPVKVGALRKDNSSKITDAVDKAPPNSQTPQHKRKRVARSDASKPILGKENIEPLAQETEDYLPVAPEPEDQQLDIEHEHTPTTSALPDETMTEEQLRLVHSAVLAKLTGKEAVPVLDLSEQYLKTSTLVEQTISAGESNSMLLIGPRGSGKTAMINQILDEQRVKHANDFHVVRLSGFIHTDDRLALRDIWRQLGREMEIKNTTHSYADTMSMLLALLSHPTDLGQAVEDNTITKSVIFILDEFDLFATHPRQTLLYNLFDIAQSRRAPIAVLGSTTRVDAAEQLEKRVKSRFSHRYVHLNLAKSVAAYEGICKTFIKLDSTSYNRRESGLIETWNNTIDALFLDVQFQQHLCRLYYRTKSVPDFMATMLLPIATLPLRDSTLSTIREHMLTRLSTSALGSSKLDGVSALPAIGAAMLVCAARQSIYSIENVSFDIAYEEYKTIASKMKLQATASGGHAFTRVWTKEVAEVAWLDLVDVGFIVDGKIDVSLAELADCGADLGQWAKWCKEI